MGHLCTVQGGCAVGAVLVGVYWCAAGRKCLEACFVRNTVEFLRRREATEDLSWDEGPESLCCL